MFTVLDQHADTLDGDVKPPLVLVGNEGKVHANFLKQCHFLMNPLLRV